MKNIKRTCSLLMIIGGIILLIFAVAGDMQGAITLLHGNPEHADMAIIETILSVISICGACLEILAGIFCRAYVGREEMCRKMLLWVISLEITYVAISYGDLFSSAFGVFFAILFGIIVPFVYLYDQQN